MEKLVKLPLFAEMNTQLYHCNVCKKRKPAEAMHKRIGWEHDRWLVCLECAAKGKHCSRCGKYQPFSAFPKQRGVNRGGVAAYCKPCMLAYKRDYYKKHGKNAHTIQKERIATILSRYGITEEEYQGMFAAQGGLCASCGKPEQFFYKDGTPHRLAVDHDHKTGAIRGLLCRGCNLALGHLHDSPERLEALLCYLRRHHGSELGIFRA